MINESELRGAESTDVCEDCFGTGTKIDPVKGALPCPCRKSDRFRKVIAAARIPRRYERCSFANYQRSRDVAGQRAASRAQVCERVSGSRSRSAVHGSGGRRQNAPGGLDHKRSDRKGFAALFYEFGSLLKEIQDSYNPISKSSELKVLAPVFPNRRAGARRTRRDRSH